MLTQFTVMGMSCSNCVAHVTKAIKDLDGISSVQVSLEEGSAIVDYDESMVNSKSIVDAIDEEGYEAQPAS